ncbi:MAG: lytic transglycosylase domain-containing protein [Caulobacterales bacterium]|nr:lytic transglycosylase domain-containing protein [Caulobacterales bacterium]MCA0372241.1 lytic transglycosylase domain-containing protein [Pseudomonadota bacterium]
MLDALIAQCAYNTHPDTVKAIIQVESAGNPYAIGVNYGGGNSRKPNNVSEAAQIARNLIAKGKNIDMGLMQINSANMLRLGLSPETIFDPCTNIRVGTKILSANYSQAVDIYGPGETALRAALSAYNTGSMVKGLRNGYVAKYYRGNSNAKFSKLQEAEIANSNVTLNAPPPANFREILVEVLDPYGSETSVYSRE